MKATSEQPADQSSVPCERSCERQRPAGCTHSCAWPCHPTLCEPCREKLRIACHCGGVQLPIACSVWTCACKGDEAESACHQSLGHQSGGALLAYCDGSNPTSADADGPSPSGSGDRIRSAQTVRMQDSLRICGQTCLKVVCSSFATEILCEN